VFPTADPTIRENDPDLKNYLVESDQKPFRLSVGARAGVSPHLWTLSDDIEGRADSSTAFEPAFHAAFYFTDLFALQTELALSRDVVSYSGIEAGSAAYTASFESYSLRLPLLARFTFRPGVFLVSAVAGVSFNIPLGAMNLNSSLYDDTSYRFSLPPGWVVGANAGIRLGPGSLFADIRFSGDFAKTAVHDSSGTLALYTRNTWSFSIGYEFEFDVKR